MGGAEQDWTGHGGMRLSGQGVAGLGERLRQFGNKGRDISSETSSRQSSSGWHDVAKLTDEVAGVKTFFATVVKATDIVAVDANTTGFIAAVVEPTGVNVMALSAEKEVNGGRGISKKLRATATKGFTTTTNNNNIDHICVRVLIKTVSSQQTAQPNL